MTGLERFKQKYSYTHLAQFKISKIQKKMSGKRQWHTKYQMYNTKHVGNYWSTRANGWVQLCYHVPGANARVVVIAVVITGW